MFLLMFLAADLKGAYAVSFAEARSILDGSQKHKRAQDPQWQPSKVFQDSLGFAQRFSPGINEAKAAQIRKCGPASWLSWLV